MFRIFFLIALFSSVTIVSAQQPRPLQVTGRIVDAATLLPVAFTSIGIDGQPFGTSSNANGDFYLVIPTEVQSRDYTLVVTCIGYKTARVRNPDGVINIVLEPEVIELKAVEVAPSDAFARKIIKKAFANVKRNYLQKPFVYKTFYRHYCKDDSTYGRLIEAAADIYKRHGYKLVQPGPGYKEEVRVTQLRRSFDNTNLEGKGHAPIALYSVMAVDPVGYQSKKRSENLTFFFDLSRIAYNVSPLKNQMREFDFYFEGTTKYDGNEVYKIRFERVINLRNESASIWYNDESGYLYINTGDYAILKYEYLRKWKNDTIRAVTIFKKFNSKYFHQYSMKEGENFYPKQNFTHTFRLELMTNEIVQKDFEKFKGKEPDREMLLKIDYDSAFWDSYTILKSTPLQEAIVRDLQKQLSLKDQYGEYLAQQRARYFGGKEDEENFNKYLKSMRGARPIYIDLWASWCGPCVKEMGASKKLLEEYKTRIAFVYLSIDENIDAWRNAVQKLELTEKAMKHFRIGNHSDFAKVLELESIPRYVLIDKAGNFVNLNARRPSDRELKKDLDALLENQN